MHFNSKKKEFLFVSVLFTIIIFSVLIFCGTLTSGLHLVDDHEFIRYTVQMKEDGVGIIELMKQENLNNSCNRFQPLYYPLRVLETVIFRANIFAMSLMKGIQIVITSILVYYFVRKLGNTVNVSLVSTAIVMAGPQSAIWWKLGTPEVTGTLVFAIAGLCLLQWKETRKWYWNVAVFACLAFDTLFKENFVLMIPAVMLAYLYISLENKEITFKNIMSAIRENLLMEIGLGVFVLWDLFMIIFGPGVEGPAYVGIDFQFSILQYIKIFLNNFRLHLRIGQYGFWVVALLILFWKDLKLLFRELKWHILLALAIILPQMVIYAKTGLEERYVIPWIYGIVYLFVIALNKSRVMQGRKRTAYQILTGILIVVNFALVIYEASYFAYRGKGIEKMFRVVEENATADTNILSAFAPYDESDKTTSFYLHTKGLDHVYVYRNGEATDWYREGKDEKVELKDVDIIMMYNFNDRHFVYEPDIDFSDFEITEYNTMRVAIRKK